MTSLDNLPRINQRREVETHSHFGGVRDLRPRPRGDRCEAEARHLQGRRNRLAEGQEPHVLAGRGAARAADARQVGAGKGHGAHPQTVAELSAFRVPNALNLLEGGLRD